MRYGRFADARVAIERALGKRPHDADGVLLLARLLCFEHRWAEAVSLLSSPQERPRSLKEARVLGLACYQAGFYMQAADLYADLLARRGLDEKARTSYSAMHQLNRALAHRRPYSLKGSLPVRLGFLPGTALPMIQASINGALATLLVDT